MKLFTKVAACALAASLATLSIAPAHAEDRTDYYVGLWGKGECESTINIAITGPATTYSEYYDLVAKRLILKMRANKDFTVDVHKVATVAANRALECGTVSADLASSTKGSANTFGSSIASLSS